MSSSTRTGLSLPQLHRAGAIVLLLALALPAAAQQNPGAYPPGPNGPPPGAYPANPLNAPTPGWPPAPGLPPGAQPALPGLQPGLQPGAAAPLQQLQALLQRERQDYGVPPQPQLQTNLHGPTPTSIPGGQLITTDRLLALYQQAAQNGLLVFDVLGGATPLPYAQNALGAAQPGSFDDPTQQQFGQYLQQITQGNRSRPLVFYCQSTQCWMSYNASLRAIRLGYSQVYWYRGGVEAWRQAQRLSAGWQPGAMQPGTPPPGYAGNNPRPGY